MHERPTPPFDEQQLTPPGLESRMVPRPQFEAPNYRACGKLLGRTALITGGDSGIGRSVAVLFAREGAQVAIAYLEQEQQDAEETARHVEQTGHEVLLVPFDVRSASSCEDCVRQVLTAFGRLDILVNNAAFQKHRPTLEDLDDAQWDTCFATNITGVFHLTKAALPHMTPGSSIINTGSITGLEGSAELLDYSATKGALHAFTKSLAQSLVERKIRVNCVAPGPVWTPLNAAERAPEDLRDFGGDTPYGRPAQPEEVAPAYVFLASHADSGFMTGEILTLLGGKTRAG